MHAATFADPDRIPSRSESRHFKSHEAESRQDTESRRVAEESAVTVIVSERELSLSADFEPCVCRSPVMFRLVIHLWQSSIPKKRTFRKKKTFRATNKHISEKQSFTSRQLYMCQ